MIAPERVPASFSRLFERRYPEPNGSPLEILHLHADEAPLTVAHDAPKKAVAKKILPLTPSAPPGAPHFFRTASVHSRPESMLNAFAKFPWFTAIDTKPLLLMNSRFFPTGTSPNVRA